MFTYRPVLHKSSRAGLYFFGKQRAEFFGEVGPEG